jgi:hypothetical protein
MTKIRDITFEATLCFFIGGLPILIAYAIGRAEFLETVVNQILPSNFPAWYAFGLSLTAIAGLFILRVVHPLQQSNRLAKLAKFVDEILWELHTDLRTVYRLGAGLLLTFSALWVIVDAASVHAGIAYFIVLGIASFIITIAYTAISKWLHAKLPTTAA